MSSDEIGNSISSHRDKKSKFRLHFSGLTCQLQFQSILNLKCNLWRRLIVGFVHELNVSGTAQSNRP